MIVSAGLGYGGTTLGRVFSSASQSIWCKPNTLNHIGLPICLVRLESTRTLTTNQATAVSSTLVPPIISAKWLSDALSNNSKNIVVLDVSWHFEEPEDFRATNKGLFGLFRKEPNTPLAPPRLLPKLEFEKQHIKGARFAGLASFTDQLSTLPNTVMYEHEFSKKMGHLGITPEDHVVVYDSTGTYSSPRAWWTLKFFGHDKVSVLDGGLPKWIKEDGALESSMPSITPTLYPEVKENKDMLIECQELKLILTDFTSANPYTLLDTRSQDRFSGRVEEPRPKVKPGYIPSAINIPYTELLEQDGTLKDVNDLALEFESRSIDYHNRSIVTMSGSGVTAAIAYLALEIVGHSKKRRMFDGGWTEWAMGSKNPRKLWV
ncbi:hypothetical protein BATDEDRAFT_25981 [Batrachochytrium dendrobatidis JAM81]|uniref:Rhodanese domain-containing protein n=2 Tax=Batrachochytrium dendrobatidis TaxID=109871 RepID=F4P673_BATDJ|nr:uncharacterized protein BATDEDRAFT_25981 [Batrachochytrium dendrobatidis JAM81]EGF79301.1 hypothetical protein BATDEDRAFT_25981 [Batrachochytrium dendrobatidis JAM81]OAJ42641.1 hypothetical protein BDEG_26070 [Batrachochytrium dendrobatidis JEL423]|eukprot:XP_006679920.1 hypothetical protein BATDEDRAFT_25981 [Batrachochytrium dendrobatidis JAM81]